MRWRQKHLQDEPMRWRSAPKRRRRVKQDYSRRLSVEELECRLAPALTLMLGEQDFTDGTNLGLLNGSPAPPEVKAYLNNFGQSVFNAASVGEPAPFDRTRAASF